MIKARTKARIDVMIKARIKARIDVMIKARIKARIDVRQSTSAVHLMHLHNFHVQHAPT